MRTIRTRTKAFRPALAGLLGVLVLLLVSCGGGGDGGNGSNSSTAPGATGPSTASYAEGPIEGFGSIIVGGMRYDDSAATIVDDDDNSAASADLKLGVIVEIDADTVDRAIHRARALRIRFGPQIVGPVQSVDASAATLVVLGQTVVVTSSTVFGDDLAGGLSTITAGEVLEVHAQIDVATGRYVATRIEDKDAADFYRVRGVVEGLDPTARTFRIGGALISYASIDPQRLTNLLADGRRIAVRMQTTQVAGAWVAVAIRAGARNIADLGAAELDGIVGRFESTTHFHVNGIEVDASAAAFPDGTAGVMTGARVEVEGTFNGGVLVASKVELRGGDRDRERFELHGPIVVIDNGQRTFTLRGVRVSFDTISGIECRGGLVVGRQVEVHGDLSTDRTRLVAARIRCED